MWVLVFPRECVAVVGRASSTESLMSWNLLSSEEACCVSEESVTDLRQHSVVTGEILRV